MPRKRKVPEGLSKEEINLLNEANYQNKSTEFVMRQRTVRKANELIQNSKYNLTTQQQKIVLYLISLIDANDDDFHLYTFPIRDFCRMCGIYEESGKNYANLKDAIEELTQKTMRIRLPNGDWTLVRWIERPYVNESDGVIRIRMDSVLKPYLLQLKQNYTSFPLFWPLCLKSKYAIRLYELVSSLQYDKDHPFEWTYTLEKIRTQLGVEEKQYPIYADFKRRVLDVAVQEVNEYTDKNVSYTIKYTGHKISHITLVVKTKTEDERTSLMLKNFSSLNRELGLPDSADDTR